ncbi:MAG: hypothetical protein ACSLE9_19235 [Burkholderiaceae bacterium]
MSCIDRRVRAGLAGLGLIAGCSSSPPPAPVAAAPAAVPASPKAAAAGTAAPMRLPPPGPVRTWAELRLQAAHRLVAANPNGTYLGEVPEPLLGIPVLEIELNGDGSVRQIVFLRHPQEAKDTSQLAADAVRRAAPFGDVSRLPKPWRFTETFLFNHERKFKPRTLDP